MTGRTKQPSGRAEQRDPAYHFTRFHHDTEANEMVCPQGQRLTFQYERELSGGRRILQWAAKGQDCRACSMRQKCCPDLKIGKWGRTVSLQRVHPAVEAFDRKMESEAAQAIYKQRAALVEFPNAWIKQKLGLRRFATRGLPKVRCEALWAALTYNLQRAFRLAPELALSR